MKKVLLGFLTILACASLHAQVNLDSGMVGCYPFTGNANDMSGHNNNGVVTGATLTKDRFNNANSAYHFRGSTFLDYISIANFPTMITGHDMSISIWGKSVSNTSTGLFLAVPDSAANRCGGFAEYTSGPYIIWDYGDFLTTGRMLYTQSPFDTNWHHYVYEVSKTNNTKQLYLDGALVMSSAYTVDYNDYGRPLYIGAYNGYNGGPLSWQGSIDDIRIYDRALDSAEVSTLYKLTNSICIPEAIPTLSESGLKIFKSSPDQLTVDIGSIAIKGKVEIINVLGQVVSSDKINSGAYTSHSINIANLSSGMYLLEIISGDQLFTKKFIK